MAQPFRSVVFVYIYIYYGIMALSSPHVPPANYAHVADGLHRSGFPNELNFLFLERLKVKTIVFLRGEVPDRFFLDWVNDQGIDLVVLDPFPVSSC